MKARAAAAARGAGADPRAVRRAWARRSIDAPILLPLGPVLDLAGEAMRGRLFLVQGDGEDAAA